MKRVPAEIEVYKEIDVEQGIRSTFGDDLINNRDNIQVFMGKSVTMGMENVMKKIVEMALTENRAQVKEQFDGVENKIQERIGGIESKIQNLANIVESKKTRNSHQLSDLCSMGIRVNDKLVFKKKYQHILHVNREFRVTAINIVQDENNNQKWKPSVESIDDEDKPHIEWEGDNLSELEKKMIVTDAKPGLLTLYNQAVDGGDEEEIEKILNKFSLNRTDNIEEQINQIEKSQWSHKNFTVFRSNYSWKVSEMIEKYLR